MHMYLIFTTSIALSMDAFAVAISCGICQKTNTIRMQLKMAIFFGIFQGIMPIIGWMLAFSFSEYIQSVDHWIAFTLLSMIGVKMIKDAKEVTCVHVSNLTNYRLVVLSVATSIDALATGISFAILNLNIYATSLVIGIVTFVLSFFGARFGKKLGARYQSGAEILGGLILIFIGIKILIEHLFGI
ncbi:MAG: manganese efflux pump MntP family protein [Eubacteriales bacterium]